MEDVHDLIHLGLLKGIVGVFKVGTRVRHRWVKPHLIKVISDVVVGGNVLFVVLNRVGLLLGQEVLDL